jgi:predicted GNAT family acetyltransferase
MILRTFRSAAEFLSEVRPSLEAHEAANNLMYGLALRMQRYPERIKIPPYFAAVNSERGIEAAAMMTPPHNLVVMSADGGPAEEAYESIARDLRRGRWPVPGVLGPNQPALGFATVWQRLTARRCTLDIHERLYELTRVVPPVGPPGGMRLAQPGEEDLVANWLYEFHREALPDEPTSLDDHREAASLRISDQDMYLWVDSQPVALAGRSRPTPNGYCIGPVYTPERFRRRGYATALTADLSQALLDSGRRFTVLFTNLANPISNSIYKKIGYQAVCDFDLYRFG